MENNKLFNIGNETGWRPSGKIIKSQYLSESGKDKEISMINPFKKWMDVEGGEKNKTLKRYKDSRNNDCQESVYIIWDIYHLRGIEIYEVILYEPDENDDLYKKYSKFCSVSGQCDIIGMIIDDYTAAYCSSSDIEGQDIIPLPVAYTQDVNVFIEYTHFGNDIQLFFKRIRDCKSRTQQGITTRECTITSSPSITNNEDEDKEKKREIEGDNTSSNRNDPYEHISNYY